ncbi:hypothetical protein [Parasphingorhabdus sp.]|uniref:hypothetical protein n=1 Tax=Parasphingorhabdus sp. TaxID=2709688 RepID=UPI0032673B38
MENWILSILMLSGAALVAGSIYLIRTGKNRKQGWLMLIAAAVMFMNVAIWTIPTPENGAVVTDSTG